MGDSRKYLNQTTSGILEFEGPVGRGSGLWTGIPKAFGGLKARNSRGLGGLSVLDFQVSHYSLLYNKIKIFMRKFVTKHGKQTSQFKMGSQDNEFFGGYSSFV